MRPDFVTKQNTPTLWKLSGEGVTFRNHHAVYPSATNVNGTALVTGVYPGKNGVIANHAYRPEIDRRRAIEVETPAAVQKGDELSAGKYISVPTIAELVQRARGRTAIATTKTVGLLLDRQVDSGNAKDCITLFAGDSRSHDAPKSIVAALGPFPSDPLQQDTWTTKALTDFLWKDGVPTFSLLWLGDPDLTEHGTAPGAPAALAAIKASDANLAILLAALERHHARETTDLFVVSDHGFSTIRRSIDLRKILNDAGWQRGAGKGTHATLSRFDMHNMLITAGPDFRRGQGNDLPSGNVDLAPTIMQILGIKAPVKMDGRILSEAMLNAGSATAGPKPETRTVEAIKDFPSGTWRQSLKTFRIGSTIYLDEGNGDFQKR